MMTRVQTVADRHEVHVELSGAELMQQGLGERLTFQPEAAVLVWMRHYAPTRMPRARLLAGDGWRVSTARVLGRIVKTDGTLGRLTLHRNFHPHALSVVPREDAPQWLRTLAEEHAPAAMAAEVDAQVVGP